MGLIATRIFEIPVIGLDLPRRKECAGPVIQKTTESILSALWWPVLSGRNSGAVPALPYANAVATGSRRTVPAIEFCE